MVVLQTKQISGLRSRDCDHKKLGDFLTDVLAEMLAEKTVGNFDGTNRRKCLTEISVENFGRNVGVQLSVHKL